MMKFGGIRGTVPQHVNWKMKVFAYGHMISLSTLAFMFKYAHLLIGDAWIFRGLFLVSGC